MSLPLDEQTWDADAQYLMPNGTVCTGVTGIALAAAGASVRLTDLPHICQLTRDNVDANCATSSGQIQVCHTCISPGLLQHEETEFWHLSDARAEVPTELAGWGF